MKDHLAELVRSSASPLHARNAVREYLQARILEALQRDGAMIPLAFHGGTALRFLFAASRYSERQTNWSGPHLTGENWRTAIGDRLRHLEWQRVAQDVHPLLEPGARTEMLTLENLERALARRSQP